VSDNGYSNRAISDEELHSARHMRHKLLQDPYRPTFHFVSPEGHAMPFDPNGNVYWRGRHHMGYIYQERGVHFWGHVSSTDLLHWRHHSPYLLPTPDSPEQGIFSGNSYLDKDGSRVLCLYHGCDAGNCLAWSDDPDLENWHKLPGNPIVPNPPEPDKADHTSWDPCGWIIGDTYYAVFGGGKNTVWKSSDLRSWTKCGPFLAHPYPGIDIQEDISCPDFFPMGDKWVMVCISHRLGARYYVGTWKNEQLHPEYHELMSHSDNEYFAPESHTDSQGRRILFAWVFDGRSDAVRGASGWSGMMALPRVLTLGSDNRLLMRPVEELRTLRYNPVVSKDIAVPAGGEVAVPFAPVTDNVLELEVELASGGAAELGVKICCAPDGQSETVIGYDVAEGRLEIDTTRTGPNQEKARSVTGTATGVIEAAPMKLGKTESLTLRVFVDRCMVEVFANDGRLALCRVVYPGAGATGIKLYAKGGRASARTVSAWDIMPTNPC
jgi:beta-fructofuranosidase